MSARPLRDLTLGELAEVVFSLDVGALTPEQVSAIGDAVRAEIRRRREAMPALWFWRRVGLASLERALEELEREGLRAAASPEVEVSFPDDA